MVVASLLRVIRQQVVVGSPVQCLFCCGVLSGADHGEVIIDDEDS